MKSTARVSLFLCFALINLFSIAQNPTSGSKSDSASLNTERKNTVYSELLGNAAGFSINFDRIVFTKNSASISLCIGAGRVPGILINRALDNGFTPNFLVYGIPISTNLFWGRRNNHFETGLGLTYQQGLLSVGQRYSQSVFAVARIGYRYQKKTGGFFWKIGLTPFFTIFDFGDEELGPVIPLAGVAFGYTIKL
jgi:hypothetical protein